MASTVERLRTLIAENLEVDGQPINLPEDLNASLLEAGVSSMELVAFGRLVSREFNVAFSPEDCANINSVQGLIEHIDSHAG